MKSTNYKKNEYLDFLKIKLLLFERHCKNMKETLNHIMGASYLQYIYLIKDLYPVCRKNPFLIGQLN